MSTEMRPKPAATVVCDLCGEPMDTYGNKDRYRLHWGSGSAPTNASPRKAWFSFFRESGWNEEKRRAEPSISWDFHGDCLIDTLTPLLRSGTEGKDQ